MNPTEQEHLRSEEGCSLMRVTASGVLLTAIHPRRNRLRETDAACALQPDRGNSIATLGCQRASRAEHRRAFVTSGNELGRSVNRLRLP